MSAGVDLRHVLAEIIQKLERDGDEHGVAESLHDIGRALSALVDAAEEIAGTVTVEPELDTPMARLDAAIARVTGEQA